MSDRREFSVLGFDNNLKFLGDYNSATYYKPNDIVLYKGLLWQYLNPANLTNIEPNTTNISSWRSLDGNSKVLFGLNNAKPSASVNNEGRLYFSTDTLDIYISKTNNWELIATTSLASSSKAGLIKTSTDSANPVVYRKETTDTLLATKANNGINTDITQLNSLTSIIISGNATLSTTPTSASAATRIVNKDYVDKKELAFINSHLNKTNDFYLGLSSNVLYSNAVISANSTLWWQVKPPNYLSGTTNFASDLTGRIALWETSSNSWKIYNSGRQSFSTGGSLLANTIYDVFAFWNGSAIAFDLVEKNGNIRAAVNSTNVTYTDGILTKTGDKTRRYIGSFFNNDSKQVTRSSRVYNADNRILQIYSQETSQANHSYNSNAWAFFVPNINYLGAPIAGFSSDLDSVSFSNFFVYSSVAGGGSAFVGIAFLNQTGNYSVSEPGFFSQRAGGYMETGLFFPYMETSIFSQARFNGFATALYGPAAPGLITWDYSLVNIQLKRWG